MEFKGSIVILEAGKKKKLLSYDLTPKKDPSLEQTLITCFQDLNLSPEEKKLLSVKDRMLIKGYQNTKCTELTKLSNKLIRAIKEREHSDLTIEAEGLGVFICFTMIHSGKLPTNKFIEFYFSNAPLSLFPEELIQSDCPNCRIHLEIDGNSWLKPIESLHAWPEKLKKSA